MPSNTCCPWMGQRTFVYRQRHRSSNDKLANTLPAFLDLKRLGGSSSRPAYTLIFATSISSYGTHSAPLITAPDQCVLASTLLKTRRSPGNCAAFESVMIMNVLLFGYDARTRRHPSSEHEKRDHCAAQERCWQTDLQDD